MSALDMKILQDVSVLPDVYKQTVLDLIASLKKTLEYENSAVAQTTLVSERRIGSRKGVKFLADGVDIDDYSDEIAELFGGKLNESFD